MRFFEALFSLYVSLWKAWSLPEPATKAHVPGTALVLYNQEVEDDTYHDHDWEWPEVPLDEDIHDLDARFGQDARTALYRPGECAHGLPRLRHDLR